MSKGHIKTLREGKIVYALIFSSRLTADRVRFLTGQDSTLQIGLLQHPAGTRIRAHRHPPLKYKVNITQEYLYIESGVVETIVYRNDWSVLKRFKLSAGDSALFMAGGHSFRILKRCRIIEVKQGPYPGDAKAKIFKPDK